MQDDEKSFGSGEDIPDYDEDKQSKVDENKVPDNSLATLVKEDDVDDDKDMTNDHPVDDHPDIMRPSSPTPLLHGDDDKVISDDENLRNDQTVDGGVFIINPHFDNMHRNHDKKGLNSPSPDSTNSIELNNYENSHAMKADKKRESLRSAFGKPDSSLAWYQIDFYTLPDKIAYMFQEMRYASNLPYLFTLFTSFGVTQSQAGIILGVRLMGTVIGNSVWGIIADKTKRHRLIVFIQVIMSLLLFLSQPFISMKFGNSETNRCPDLVMNSTSSVGSNSTSFTATTTLYKEEDRTLLFWILLILNIAICFFEGSIGSFQDVAVIRKIELAPYKIDFGAQRKFGTIGYAIGVTVSKAIMDLQPSMTISCMSLVFAVYPVFIFVELICTQYLLSLVSFNTSDDNDDVIDSEEGIVLQSPIQNKTDETITKKDDLSYSRKCFNVLKKIDTLIFFLTALIIGMEISSKAFFVVSYIKDKDSIPLFFTLFFWVSSISIFFGFGFSFRIIRRIGGTWNAMILVCLTNGVKFFGYVYLPGVWPLLACEVLDFIVQGLAVTAVIAHVGLISNVDILTFMFSLTNSLTFGLGFLITSVSGGYIYEFYGGRMFYTIQAVFSLSWTFFLVVYRMGRRLTNSRTRDISI